MAGADAMSSSSPNKRPKTLTPDSTAIKYEAIRSQEEEEEEQRRRRKQSASMAEDGAESSASCGICLCESGRAIRGHIDSCDHYFCFVCIMEWAKVESRCPMCKRRFTTIRRPPKHGLFPSERLVNVPHRDQVYHYFGNTTVATFDPYAEVNCIVCHKGTEENFLLLCDLCDSASHTYCVGLGATVPEGDWFCHDCTVSRTEHDTIQKDDDEDRYSIRLESNVTQASEPRFSFDNSEGMEVAEADISVLDIVSESEYLVGATLQGSLSCRVAHGQQPIPADEVVGPSSIAPESKPGERTPHMVGNYGTQMEARTLSRCRNVHGYIQALRENWNALRVGSLSFSSNSLEPGSKGSQTNNNGTGNVDNLDCHSSSSSKKGRVLTIQDGFSGSTRQDRSYWDVDKAWKMMNRAKSIHCASAKSVHQASKHYSCIKLSPHLSKKQIFKKTIAEKHNKHCSLEKQTEKKAPLMSEKEKQRKIGIIKTVHSSIPTSHLPGFSAHIFSWKGQASSQHEVSNSDSLNNGQAQLVPSFSCNKIDTPEGKVRSVKSCPENEQFDEAKTEIQTIVKLNLKLLSRNKKLGVDAFKEVARVATHTILAACGLSHSRNAVRSFRKCFCSHSEQIQLSRKSTLMPNSCRECFYVFVKDVVNSVLSEKIY